MLAVANLYRTQLLLEESQYRFLKNMAHREGKSLSQVVRQLVAEKIAAQQQRERGGLEALAGIIDDPGLAGRDHDRVLYHREGKR